MTLYLPAGQKCIAISRSTEMVSIQRITSHRKWIVLNIDRNLRQRRNHTRFGSNVKPIIKNFTFVMHVKKTWSCILHFISVLIKANKSKLSGHDAVVSENHFLRIWWRAAQNLFERYCIFRENNVSILSFNAKNILLHCCMRCVENDQFLPIALSFVVINGSGIIACTPLPTWHTATETKTEASKGTILTTISCDFPVLRQFSCTPTLWEE